MKSAKKRKKRRRRKKGLRTLDEVICFSADLGSGGTLRFAARAAACAAASAAAGAAAAAGGDRHRARGAGGQLD